MHREDPEVMAQYLKCLSRVNNSNRKYSSIETHIVVDDAFTVSGSLNAHAQTFIDLCKEMLHNSTVTHEIRMPYGSEILVTLEDGMPVYLHFKDCLKVRKYFRTFKARFSRMTPKTLQSILSHPSEVEDGSNFSLFMRAPGLASALKRGILSPLKILIIGIKNGQRGEGLSSAHWLSYEKLNHCMRCDIALLYMHTY